MKNKTKCILKDVAILIMCLAFVCAAVYVRLESGAAGILAVIAPFAFIIAVVMANNLVEDIKNKKI